MRKELVRKVPARRLAHCVNGVLYNGEFDQVRSRQELAKAMESKR
jgi:hypothetical protein